MKNHFECDEVTKALRIKVAKSRLRGSSPTWWKYLQEEREKLGNNPIENWKTMVMKVKEQYLSKGYEVQLHKKKKCLKQKDMNVLTYIEEF